MKRTYVVRIKGTNLLPRLTYFRRVVFSTRHCGRNYFIAAGRIFEEGEFHGRLNLGFLLIYFM